jgi:site-specific recombinase XerD
MSISPKEISRFKVKRRGENAAAGSINRELAMLSKAFNLAVKEWEWLNENPVSKVPYEKENNEMDRWLTTDEERRLLTNSPVWLSDIIVFATNTGVRQSELLSLEWPQVELERKVILLLHTKNGKPRTIPLNQNATNVLMRKAGGKVRSLKSNVVFASGSGTMINRNALMRAFAIAVKKAGLVGVTFHTCRHTFCTRLAQKGIDIYKISKLVGHEDIRMTQRYSHHCTESLRDGVGILDSDYNLTTIGQI